MTRNTPVDTAKSPSVDNNFWLSTWRDEQQYGFHQLSASPMLVSNWQQVDVRPNARILVPLCGKSLDIIWLADQGYTVIGVELSPIAVKSFFAENNLKPKKQRMGNFTRWQYGNITIFCGDFFSLPAKLLGRIDAVFDRAALTALPDELKADYLRALLLLMSPNARILLLTVEEIIEQGKTIPADSIDIDLEALCCDLRAITLLHTEIVNAGANHSFLPDPVYNKAYLLESIEQ